jgi:L-asparaginase
MPPTPTHIHLIITGGTIDSYFDRRKDSNVPSSESFVRKFLEETVEPHFTISQKVIAMKDSRDINEDDRQKMLNEILNCNHDRILITHGTFTIPDTAQFLLDRKTGLEKKTIVITGAFYPLARFSDTDAAFNLGFAIASLFHAKPGVYVAMNGQLFEGDKVKKDVREGRFVTV